MSISIYKCIYLFITYIRSDLHIFSFHNKTLNKTFNKHINILPNRYITLMDYYGIKVFCVIEMIHTSDSLLMFLKRCQAKH